MAVTGDALTSLSIDYLYVKELFATIIEIASLPLAIKELFSYRNIITEIYKEKGII